MNIFLTWNLDEVNYWSELFSVLLAISEAIIIALITGIILNKTFQKEKTLGKKLNTYGIQTVKISAGTLSIKGRNMLFGLNGYPIPREVDLCFITGSQFFIDYGQKCNYLSNLVLNGCRVKVSIANPNEGTFKDLTLEDIKRPEYLEKMSSYYCELLQGKRESTSFLERTFVMLNKNNLTNDLSSNVKDKLRKFGDHNYQVKLVRKIIEDINSNPLNKGKIELHYYKDEYRVSMMIARMNPTKKKDAKTNVWTNMNAPITETMDSISVFSSVTDSGKAEYVDDLIKSFDFLVNIYPDQFTNSK